MKTRILLTSISALAATAALGSQAFAQTLDYDAMSGLFGEPVTAGATGAPQRASDVPATMIIITREDIQRFPEYDIPGVLRHFAGMDVTRYAFGDGQVNIRGHAAGNTPRLLVLVNGREVYIDTYGYTAWSALPVQFDEIQQIEVVKGPQTALYGFNAVGGVVNIITRNPDQGNYLTARVNYGGDAYTEASLVGGHAFNDRFSVRFSLARTDAEEFDSYAANTNAISLEGTDFSREAASLQARLRVSDNVNVSAEATRTEGFWAENTAVYFATSSVYEVASQKIDVEADTDWGFLTFSGYRNDITVGPSFGQLDAQVTAYRIQDLFKIGTSDTIRISAEYREGSTVSFPMPGNGDFGYETTAFSAMWNHKFSNAVDLTLAGRHDSVDWSRDSDPNPFIFPFSAADHAVTFEEFSYNAALVWRPQSGGAVRLMAGRGIQAPTMFDIGFTLPTSGVVLSGNPNIQPAIVTSYEIAYDREFSNGVGLRTSIFAEQTEDVKGAFGMVPDLLPPTVTMPTYLFDNRGDTETFGVEVSLDGDIGTAWNWDANYTYKQVNDDLTPFGLTTPLDFEGATPTHIANGHLGWTGGRFTADGYVNYVSSVDMPMQPFFGPVFSVPVDAYLALSLRGGFEINDHVAVSATAHNANFGDGEITNTQHQNESRFWFGLTISR